MQLVKKVNADFLKAEKDVKLLAGHFLMHTYMYYTCDCI